MSFITENNNTMLSGPQQQHASLFFDHQKSPDNRTIDQIWTKENFNHKAPDTYYPKTNLVLDLKTTWAIKEDEALRKSVQSDEDEEKNEEQKEEQLSPAPSTPDKESPTFVHHARRPMNAFLIFCKKHRPVVRKRYPSLENRGVTRILGEWWALLEDAEKMAYKQLALQYKDAFLSANPNFKWYKLPAPPLRTANARTTVGAKTSPLLSPTHLSSFSTEFTPGKLADETQLGNLTSLMNLNRNSCVKSNGDEDGKKDSTATSNNNSNDEDVDEEDEDPKPMKKRKDSEEEKVEMDNSDEEGNNMTQQELMNKVVESMFPDHSNSGICSRNSPDSKQEVRKSGRTCKGRRYAEFMMEGNLLGNKQMKLFTSKLDVKNKFELDFDNKIDDYVQSKTPKLDLSDTIKRLAERTNTRLDDLDCVAEKRKRTESENSEDGLVKMQADFNLDQRIAELPSLNYEVYVQRKKESKRRKPMRAKPDTFSHKPKTIKSETNPVGSKKRKNKNSITRLEQPESYIGTFNADLLGLATLAEVAANTEKIN